MASGQTDEQLFSDYVRRYKIGDGVADLSRKPATDRDVFLLFRQGHRETLDAAEKPPGVRIYFDYVDSGVENAFAGWGSESLTFIGVTEKLADALFEHAAMLGDSEAVLLVNSLQPKDGDALGLTIVHLALAFVMCHEFSHLYWRHVAGALNHVSEVRPTRTGAGLAAQVNECMADGYCLRLVIEQLLAGPIREGLANRLGIERLPAIEQTRILVSLAITSVVPFFIMSVGAPFRPRNAETASHPPTLTRADFMMRELRLWAEQNPDRVGPELALWINGDTYRAIMNAAIGATAPSRTKPHFGVR